MRSMGDFFVSQIGNKLLHSVARALKHNTHQYYHEREERIVGEDEQRIVFVVVDIEKKNNKNKYPMQSKRLSKTKLGRSL